MVIKVEFVSTGGAWLGSCIVEEIPRKGDSIQLFDRQASKRVSIAGDVKQVLWKLRPTGLESYTQEVEIWLKNYVIGEDDPRKR